MKRLIIIGLSLFFINSTQAQITADSITKLDSKIQESSGLLYLNGNLFTHNDSGNEPAIYEVDTTNGSIIRKVIIKNASNKDWEDITCDENNIYIGDFGNNQGSRTDLKIYYFPKSELLNSLIDSIAAETIEFNYKDQTDFTPSNFTTIYDAEAFVALGDSLYVFTKNWGDFRTNIYSCPKVKGDYALSRIGSANTMGMVTGATYNPKLDMIVLCGYSFTGSFIAKFSNIASPPFTNIDMDRYNLLVKQSIQIEGIAYANDNKYFLTSEAFQGTESLLSKLETDKLLSISSLEQESFSVFPNPFKESFNLSDNSFKSSQVIDLKGNVLLQSEINELKLSTLQAGVYFLKVMKDGKTFITKIIKKE